MNKITVLIPCYNEAEAIADVVRKVPQRDLHAAGYDVEILVVDNNSTDNTTEIARAAGARVVHEAKQGKGNAIRTGFYSLSDDTEYVVMLDGDDTYRAEEILRLVEPIRSGFAQVILGSRIMGYISVGSMHRMNRAGNVIFSWLVRTVYRVPVTDVLTGYYAWSIDAVKELRPHLQSTNFAIEMEMTTKMARLNQRLYSVPISYDSRQGDSSLHPVRDGARILRMFLSNLTWNPSLQHSSISKELHAAGAVNGVTSGEHKPATSDSPSI
ncbi:MAG TPA: glycosyltransferase family 2 protein [Candidatus Saccharimonadales bacterium]|nr:glycosyltransferase family 2 protein [Candidatus Saccharimonadales bacterium]